MRTPASLGPLGGFTDVDVGVNLFLVTFLGRSEALVSSVYSHRTDNALSLVTGGPCVTIPPTVAVVTATGPR